jgi:NAD(P)-dependent dehydrogenase (short-subunit alcohol dehydrogenase family)
VWLCLKYEIPQMLKQGQGAIVNNASGLGLVGLPTLPAYVASKHGVVGLTKTAALEYARMGLRINAVCPGAVRTALYEERIFKAHPHLEEIIVTALEPVGRMGQPEEIAAAVVWLCSDAASFVTGQAMAVDGGWVAQ